MTNLISFRRGRLYDSTGAQLALHFWIGPFGLHVFRRPFGVAPEFDRDWRR